jgi:hypothetical protein
VASYLPNTLLLAFYYITSGCQRLLICAASNVLTVTVVWVNAKLPLE